MSVKIPFHWKETPDIIRIMSLIGNDEIYCEFLDAKTKRSTGHCVWTLIEGRRWVKYNSRGEPNGISTIAFNKILNRIYHQLVIENELFGPRS